MTIKQQGGIFGRNPTFNNVTVDGALTVDQIMEKTDGAGITLDGVTLKDGNVALADGNGIDFSATSGTGTSKLFDDYEEGTWNMVLSAASGSFTSITYDPNVSAFYTKIGRLVTIQGFFRTDSITTGTASGDIYISLPFTSATLPGYGDGSAGVVSFATNWGGDVPCSVSPRGGDAKMNLHYRTTANGNFSNIQVGDLGTGSGANYTVFAAQYIAS